jgi:hypothetical protein
MADIEDKAYRSETLKEASKIAERAEKKCLEVLSILDGEKEN